MQKHALLKTVTVLASFAMFAGVALAGNPAGTGQPGADCEQSTTAPAGFATAGFAHAKLVYAGSDGTKSLANGNAHAVSQYDVACYQLSN